MTPAQARPVLVVGPHSVHVRRFVAGLCEAGRDVVLVTNAPEPLVTHERLREQVFMSLRLLDWRTPQRLRALIERWKPSVVHVHQADATAWHAVRAARPTGVPVVLTLWGSDVLSLPHQGWWQRAMVRHALRGAAAWTADARVLLQAAQAIVGAGAPPWREWIPLGIDAPPEADALGPVVRERRILSCRLHKPLYRIDVIVRAFAQAAPQLPGWVLEVAAAGEQTPALRDLAQSLGVADRVLFTGMLSADQLSRAYRRSALFVSVPESDGTSVSLLEAMAAGCLPVLADLPANREWVRDGENGLIVGVNTSLPADLSTAVASGAPASAPAMSRLTDPPAPAAPGLTDAPAFATSGLIDALARGLVRGAHWWTNGRWDATGRPHNEALIARHATLSANVQQFLALHERLVSPRRPVVHLTTVHPRDDIRIFRKECVSLAQAGYEVVQVVGDGLGDAEVQGVRIVDIGARPTGRLARMRQQPAKALAVVRALKPALVHLHDPELLPVGARLAREGLTVVYDAHEDVPRQLLTKQWIPAWARRPLSAAFEVYENHRVRQLAAVVGATPHITQRFAAVARRSVNVSNFPFLEELVPVLASAVASPLQRESAVCYVGGIFHTRGAFSMVRALTHLPGVRLILCGRFENAATEAALRAEPGWAQVQYLGVVGRDGVREVMARSRAGLVTLLPLPSYLDSLPIKMFEYMSAGLPVIASDFPLWRGIVQAHACGLCVDPQDPAAIARAIAQVLADPAAAQAMGQAGQEAVHAHYHWPRAEGELLALYRSLLPSHSLPTP